MGLETLLSRLQGVKRTRQDQERWIARCPAHLDKSPSLAIRGEPDGRILMHCFAGCDPGSILDAVGLNFTDLFPEALTKDFVPRVTQPFSALDALKCLAQEAAIVSIASSDIILGKPLSDMDLERVATAAGRIASALEVVYA